MTPVTRQLTETLANALLHPAAAARKARNPDRPRAICVSSSARQVLTVSQ